MRDIISSVLAYVGAGLIAIGLLVLCAYLDQDIDAPITTKPAYSCAKLTA